MLRKSLIGLAVIAVAAVLCAAGYAQQNGNSLPQAVTAAVQKLFPDATIGKSEVEQESIKLFEVAVDNNGTKTDVEVAGDGTVMEVETVESIDSVPAAVATALQGLGEVKEVEKVIKYAELKVSTLDAPLTIYEAEVVVNGKKTEVTVDASGAVQQSDDQDDKDEDDDDDDDKDDEDDD